jgi:hypothetical protein
MISTVPLLSQSQIAPLQRDFWDADVVGQHVELAPDGICRDDAG